MDRIKVSTTIIPWRVCTQGSGGRKQRGNQVTGQVAKLSKGTAVGFTLSHRSQLSVAGGSILAPVSNSKAGENIILKAKGAVRGVVWGQAT